MKYTQLFKSIFLMAIMLAVAACGDAGTPGGNGGSNAGDNKVPDDSEMAQEMDKRQQGTLSPKAETSVHWTGDAEGAESPIIPYINTVAWKTGFTLDFVNPDPKTGKVKTVNISNHISDHGKAVTIYYYTKKGVKFAEEVRPKDAVIDNGSHFSLSTKFPAGTTLDDITTILTLAVFDEGGNGYYVVGPPIYNQFPADAKLTNVG